MRDEVLQVRNSSKHSTALAILFLQKKCEQDTISETTWGGPHSQSRHFLLNYIQVMLVILLKWTPPTKHEVNKTTTLHMWQLFSTVLWLNIKSMNTCADKSGNLNLWGSTYQVGNNPQISV